MSWELGRPSSAPAAAGGREACPSITGAPGKWWVVERESEGVVVCVLKAVKGLPVEVRSG